jgi:hypothetical protein
MAKRSTPGNPRGGKRPPRPPHTTPPGPLEPDEPPPSGPTFVFEGTVLALGSTTLAEVEASEHTIVARIDAVHQGPPLLHDFIGHPVTVRLGDGQSVEPGGAYLFHTVSWVFGTGVAVICLALEPAHEQAVSALQAQVAAAPLEAIRTRAARADLVVHGHVSEVREAARDPGAPITEHDPHWQDAVVQVHQASHRKAAGAAPQKVLVRFSASRDVRWATAPKFHVGQRGMWMLGDTSPRVAAARTAMALAPDHYLCVEPEDFVPEEHAAAAAAALNQAGER